MFIKSVLSVGTSAPEKRNALTVLLLEGTNEITSFASTDVSISSGNLSDGNSCSVN